MREKTVSRTAIIVAKSQALIGATPGLSDLIDSEALNFITNALRTAGHTQFVSGIRNPVFRRAVRLTESFLIPGLALHQVLRKRIIEEQVLKALESGVKEIVQIGAGLDSLCFRLHKKCPGVNFTEIDHPATQEIKRNTIRVIGGCAENLIFKPLNLNHPDSQKKSNPENTDRSRLIIAEGLLMYLSPLEIKSLLRNWRLEFGNHSQFLFTFFSERGFWRQSPLVDVWLRLIGEPFRWWAEPEAVSELLSKSGWNIVKFRSTWNDIDGISKNQIIAKGEWIGEAMGSI